ncbi:helix-turn-helix domain-containing protein [Sinorhizobium meliloti]|uniref:helix-turn-helix domain-containing protein n=1 Tax=Rhizobium meliloti TaxID=382 RepID=UPI00299F11EB
MSAKYDSKRTKTDVLIEDGTFNSTPEKVRDPKFRGSEFFDPHDAVQVKYEMLRRVSIDKVSVTEASDEYGVSRPTYCQAKVNFDMAGIAGLVPTKPGPRGPHKIDDKVVAFLQAHLAPGEPVRARELAELLRQELDIELHPRSIERVLKKRQVNFAATAACPIQPSTIASQYEVLRKAALGAALTLIARSGLLLFLRRGCGDGLRRWPQQQSPRDSRIPHRQLLGRCTADTAPSFTSLRQSP